MRVFLSTFVIFLTLSFFVACGEKKEAEMQTQQQEAMQAEEGQEMEGEMAAILVVDPVCGMKVNKEETQFTTEYQGETYYFCSEADKLAFVESPEEYLAEPEE